MDRLASMLIIINWLRDFEHFGKYFACVYVFREVMPHRCENAHISLQIFLLALS
jgi:hypothetical protein